MNRGTPKSLREAISRELFPRKDDLENRIVRAVVDWIGQRVQTTSLTCADNENAEGVLLDLYEDLCGEDAIKGPRKMEPKELEPA